MTKQEPDLHIKLGFGLEGNSALGKKFWTVDEARKHKMQTTPDPMEFQLPNITNFLPLFEWIYSYIHLNQVIHCHYSSQHINSIYQREKQSAVIFSFWNIIEIK